MNVGCFKFAGSTGVLEPQQSPLSCPSQTPLPNGLAVTNPQAAPLPLVTPMGAPKEGRESGGSEASPQLGTLGEGERMLRGMNFSSSPKNETQPEQMANNKGKGRVSRPGQHMANGKDRTTQNGKTTLELSIRAIF